MATLVISFAVLVTTHLALAVGLALRGERWRGALAFFVPPLAAYWGFEAGMKLRAGVWIAALVAYVGALMAAR